jgi:hypothetical protein
MNLENKPFYCRVVTFNCAGEDSEMIDRPSWVSCRVTVSPPNMILLRGASRLEAIRWWPDGIVKEEITDLTVQFGLYP